MTTTTTNKIFVNRVVVHTAQQESRNMDHISQKCISGIHELCHLLC